MGPIRDQPFPFIGQGFSTRLAVPALALAQSYPVKPIRRIVPHPAGEDVAIAKVKLE